MGQAMIEVRDLTKTFGAVEAVRGISFRVDTGEIVGFLGPNGAGKTTTLRILAGIFPPTSGEVRIAGRDPARDPLACRRAVGYFPEYAPFYPDLRVEGYLRFVARMKRIPRAEPALPGVERVAREADAFVLEAAAAGDATRAAGEAMAARGWTIRELRAETPDLEQIFLRLVGDGEQPRA